MIAQFWVEWLLFFDNMSGAVSKRRAFTVCLVDTHPSIRGRCERAVYVEDFGGDPKRAASFLLAWRLDADKCPCKWTHLGHDPSDEDIAFAETLVYG